MVARRGTPAYILSDNGTNFDQEKIINKLAKDYNIEWKFNPPSAPHFSEEKWTKIHHDKFT
jgi:hypothetical protein